MAGSGGKRALPSVPLEPLLDKDPREVGPFRLLGRLGAGGMGVAYLADGLGQWAVVKVVRSELAEDQGFRARLGRELAAVGRLDGESARVLQADVDASAPWFAMEFIPGQTLDHWVKDRGPLAGQALADFAAALARLLAGVHAAGIVHRDIKPSNVMLSPDGPRLIDFGIADVDEGTQLTKTGSVLGTLGWLAPEQVRGDATSTATDVHAWALCVVFAATGEAPFGSDASAAALYRVLESTPDVPVTLGQPLRGLVQRALAKDAGRRPSIDEMLSSLGGTPTPAIDKGSADAQQAAAQESIPSSASGTEPVRLVGEPGLRGAPGLPPLDRPAATPPEQRRAVPWEIAGSIVGTVAVLFLGLVVMNRQAPVSPAPVSQAPVSQAPVSQAPECDGDSVPCEVGDVGPGGGVVFYDAGSQQEWGRYLEAAPAGWSGSAKDPRAQWCADDQPGYGEVLATGTGIGAGGKNTGVIIKACGKDSAAGVARAYAGGGLDDWCLPSKDELAALYERSMVVGGLAVSGFWSSSQYDSYANNAWFQSFASGYQSNGNKGNNGYRVRPVRAF